MGKPFFLIAAFVAMLTLVSCGADDGVENTKVANTSEFDKDLNDYVTTMEDILSEGTVTRAAGDSVTYEELLSIAASIDSTTLKFYQDHPQIADALPKLPEEYIELMKVDVDTLLAFVKANYSDEFYQNFVTRIYTKNENARYIPMPSTASDVDKTLNANLYIYGNFKNLVGNTLQITGPCEDKERKCWKEYISRRDECQKALCNEIGCLVVGVLVSLPTPAEVVLCTLSTLMSVYSYYSCLNDAKTIYDLCVK